MDTVHYMETKPDSPGRARLELTGGDYRRPATGDQRHRSRQPLRSGGARPHAHLRRAGADQFRPCRLRHLGSLRRLFLHAPGRRQLPPGDRCRFRCRRGVGLADQCIDLHAVATQRQRAAAVDRHYRRLGDDAKPDAGVVRADPLRVRNAIQQRRDPLCRDFRDLAKRHHHRGFTASPSRCSMPL